jgi:Predicted membrane protein (DUF2339)
MPSEQHSLEQRIGELNLQVVRLGERVEQLEQQINAKPRVASNQAVKSSAVAEEKAESGSLLHLDSSSLLQIVAVLCFLLVVALGLRALTDNGLLGSHLGSILGIFYAASLIIGGHFFYRKANALAPVFCITGAVVMFSVMVEAHTRFSALPEAIAYLVLAVTGIGMATISYLNKVALPIIVGTLGMCFAAVAIGYPTPHYPYLALMLWASNILGFFATRLKRCSWLRWLLLVTTHFMLQLWGLKLVGVMVHSQDKPELLVPGLFIPIVALIGFTFMMIALFGIIRSGDEKISKFDFTLPAVNAAWCYVAGIYALKDPEIFGVPAAAAAVIHFALAYWLSRRPTSNAQGTNAFTAGGLILACLSLPALFNDMLLPLPILSTLAFATCYFANRWSSGGMRISSYLLQAYISAIIIIEFGGSAQGQLEAPAILIAVLFCCVISGAHFYYARQSRPPENSKIFNQYDKKDNSALLVLCASLINSFFASMIIAHYVLQYYYHDDMTVAFTATQSIIISFAAIFIMVQAFFNYNSELRNIAILILLIGGCKVFIFDMLNISGAWLVASLFSFGIAAALESLVLARWKTADVSRSSSLRRQTEPPAETN